MSNGKDREGRREERIAAEREATAGDRRGRLLQVAAGTVFLAIIAVVVVIVVSSGGSSGGEADNVQEVAKVDALLGKLPQTGLTIGHKSAPVELVEYGDLQCPFCKAYSEEKIPALIEGQVDEGKAKITFRNFLIIGEQSLPAGAAAIAAGEQGRGWNFIEIFYRNQGEENSGYVTEEFIESIGRAAGIKDMAGWNKARKSKRVLAEAEATTREAGENLGFHATPSFAVKGPSSDGLELLGTPETTGELEEAIEGAA